MGGRESTLSEKQGLKGDRTYNKCFFTSKMQFKVNF